MAEFIGLMAAFNKERARIGPYLFATLGKTQFGFGGQRDQKLLWPRFTEMLGQAAIYQRI